MKDVKDKYSFIFSLDDKIKADRFIDSEEEEEVYIHPVLVKDMGLYGAINHILTLSKQEISIKFIKLSYYDFLTKYIKDLLEQEDKDKRKLGEELFQCLSILLSLVFRKEGIARFSFSEKENKGNIYFFEIIEENGKTKEKKYRLKRETFDEFRYLIIYQNDPLFVDTSEYSEDIKKVMERRNKISSGKEKGPSFEDRLDVLYVELGIQPSEIKEVKNMTIRRFQRLFERVYKKTDYIIMKTALSSGFITLKDNGGLKHWTGSIEKDPMEGLFIDYDSVQNTVTGKNG